MAGKSPAFQWYSKDFDADEVVKLMTMEEEGVYRRLLDHCWHNGSIPTDMRALGAICKNLSDKRMAKLWPSMSAKFHPHPTERGRLINRRVERERAKQAEFSEKRRRAAYESHKHRHGDGAPDPKVAELVAGTLNRKGRAG